MVENFTAFLFVLALPLTFPAMMVFCRLCLFAADPMEKYFAGAWNRRPYVDSYLEKYSKAHAAEYFRDNPFLFANIRD